MLCVAVLFCQTYWAYAEIHGTVTGTTDYIWRMYSKSNQDPAIQGNLDYQHSSGFYGGASVSSVNFGPSDARKEFHFQNQARAEIAPYLGWSFNLADDWRFDTQYSRYFYDGKIYEFSGDYNEFYMFLHYKDLFSAQASFTDDFYGMGDIAFNYELTGRYPVTNILEFSGTFGYAQTRPVFLADYPYWNLGLTGRYKFIALDLRYYDASEIYYQQQQPSIDHPDTLKATLVFSISVGF
ncbi:MAG: TorF family putative porin [Methylobacter sp.]|nr:TorF family putative porin [Methylobacter sp.]